MTTEGSENNLVQRLRDNDRTSALREIMRRAPLAPSRAGSIAAESTAESTQADPGAPDPRPRHPQGTVPALANSLMVISFLNSHAPAPQTLATIAGALRMTKSHCHSILRTLVYFDWVGFDDAMKSYQLLPSALSDLSSLLSSPLLELTRGCLAEFVEETNLPGVIAQPLLDKSFVVIDTCRAPHCREVFYPIGQRFPRNASAHLRALIAWAGPDRIAAHLADWRPTPFTPASPTRLDEVHRALEATRARGYALSVDEVSDNMTAIALPVFDRRGEVAYILSCSFLSDAAEFDSARIARALGRAVSRIHRQALSQPPQSFRPSP